jgi:hypothetical protein
MKELVNYEFAEYALIPRCLIPRCHIEKFAETVAKKEEQTFLSCFEI